MSAFPRRPDSGRRTKSSAPSPGARGLGGIYRGWWVVSAPFLVAALNTGAGQYGFGVFIPPLESEFGWTRAEINFALSFTAAGGLLAPLIGPVIDRYGTKPVMAVSLGIIAASFLARPLMTDLLHWYALSFLQYVGYSAASMMCAGKLVGMWFQRRRGRAMGITAMGNNVGGIFAPPIMVAVLAFTGGDWRAVFVALGAMSAGLVLYTLAATRDFPSADDLGGEMLDRPAAGGSPMTGITLVEALRGRSFYALTLTVTLGFFTYSAVIPSILPHLAERGASVAAATAALSAYAVMGVVGKFCMGLLAERIAARRALMINFAGQSIFSVAMIWTNEPALMWTVVPLLGFFNGAFGALFQLAAMDAFGVRHFGSVMGVVNFISVVVAYLIGPWMAGAFYDATGEYAQMLLICAAMFAAAIAAMGFVKKGGG